MKSIENNLTKSIFTGFKLRGRFHKVDKNTPDLDTSFDLVKYIYPFDLKNELNEIISRGSFLVSSSKALDRSIENAAWEFLTWESLTKVKACTEIIKGLKKPTLLITKHQDTACQIREILKPERINVPTLIGNRASHKAYLVNEKLESYKAVIAYPEIAPRLCLHKIQKIIFIDPVFDLKECDEILLRWDNIFNEHDQLEIEFLV